MEGSKPPAIQAMKLSVSTGGVGVRDPGRIINSHSKTGLIGIPGPVIGDISAGKAFPRGAFSASGGIRWLIISEHIIILSASMTRASSSHRLERVPTCKTAGVR